MQLGEIPPVQELRGQVNGYVPRTYSHVHSRHV